MNEKTSNYKRSWAHHPTLFLFPQAAYLAYVVAVVQLLPYCLNFCIYICIVHLWIDVHECTHHHT